MIYKICGVRPTKDNKHYTKVCLIIKTDLPLFSVLPDTLLNVLGTEINRHLNEMKDIKNYQVMSLEELPPKVKDYLLSEEAKEIEQEQGFIVLYLEEAPTSAFLPN